MFDLNQAIAGWRRQLQAAGIKDRELLDELEGHLGEEAEQQMKERANAQQAFEVARLKMGRIDLLKEEFAKAQGPWGWLGYSRAAKINRILAVLWLAGCAWSLNTMCRVLVSAHAPSASPETSFFALNSLITAIYLVGMAGSVLLFQGALWGHRLIRMLALLLAIVCAVQILDFRLPVPWRAWCGGIGIFSLISVVLLRSSSRTNPKRDMAEE